jgi:hypothetical protein
LVYSERVEKDLLSKWTPKNRQELTSLIPDKTEFRPRLKEMNDGGDEFN